MDHDQGKSSSLAEESVVFDSSLQVGSNVNQNAFSLEMKDGNDNSDNLTVSSTKSLDQARSSGDPRSPAQMVRRLGQFNMRRDPIGHNLLDIKASQTNNGSQHEDSTVTKKRQYRDTLSSDEKARQITDRMVAAAPQQRLDEFRKKYQQLRREPKNSVAAPYDFSFRNRRDVRHYREDGFDDSLSVISYSTDTNFSAFNGSTQQSGDDNPFTSQIGDGNGDGLGPIPSFGMVDNWEPPFSPVGKGKAVIQHSTSSQQQAYRPSTLSQRVYDLDEILANETIDNQEQPGASVSSTQQRQQQLLTSTIQEQQKQQEPAPSNQQQDQHQQEPPLSSHLAHDSDEVMSSKQSTRGPVLSPQFSMASAKRTDHQPSENQQRGENEMDDDDFEFDDMQMDDYVPSTSKASPIARSSSGSVFAGAAEGSSSKMPGRPIEDLLNDFNAMPDFNEGADVEVDNGDENESMSRPTLATKQVKRVSPGSRFGLRRLYESSDAPLKSRGMLTSKVVKSIFSSTGNTLITAAADRQLSHMQVTETNIFFEQAMDNLASYAKHAGRNSITDVDARLLLKRQEVLHDKTSLEALAHQYLPRELWDEVCVSATAYNVIYPFKDDDDDDD